MNCVFLFAIAAIATICLAKVFLDCLTKNDE